MNISAMWSVVLAGPARKSLKRVPASDRLHGIREVPEQGRETAVPAATQKEFISR